MIHTILTPLDGSTHGQMALDFSCDLAGRYNAQLVLIYVCDGDGEVPQALYDNVARALQEAEGQPASHSRILAQLGHEILNRAKAAAEEKGVTRVETVLTSGDPGDEILGQAKVSGADLIVMGSRGLGMITELILGSVSHKVFHLAHCSCVTVSRDDARPGLESVESIFVPTDGSPQADKAVGMAAEVADKYGARLTLLYVMLRGPSLAQLRQSVSWEELSQSARDELDPEKHPIAEHLSGSLAPPVVSKACLEEIGQQVLDRSKRIASSKGVSSPKLLLRHGDTARAIINFAKQEKADLIAMGSRGLGRAEGVLAGSVSYKVVHSADCSCMIVR